MHIFLETASDLRFLNVGSVRAPSITVSGRRRMCSSCVFFWYTSSIFFPVLGLPVSGAMLALLLAPSGCFLEAAAFDLGAALLAFGTGDS